MNHQQIVEAIQFIRPKAQFTLTDNNVEWLDAQQIEPSIEEIEQGWLDYQAKVKADKEAAKTKKSAALEKLLALGFDEDDVKALGF